MWILPQSPWPDEEKPAEIAGALGVCLDPKYFPKFYYVKRRFLITSKCRYMYGVLNVDEIKN
jgi:hypothetical protein